LPATTGARAEFGRHNGARVQLRRLARHKRFERFERERVLRVAGGVDEAVRVEDVLWP
jgi:hypothetical protein